MGIRICNTENVHDKMVSISFRRRDELKPNVFWGVLEKVVQSNAGFGFSDSKCNCTMLGCLLVTVVRRQKGDP